MQTHDCVVRLVIDSIMVGIRIEMAFYLILRSNKTQVSIYSWVERGNYSQVCCSVTQVSWLGLKRAEQNHQSSSPVLLFTLAISQS